MNKIMLSPRLLAEFVAVSPEGFFHQSHLDRYTGGPEATAALITEAVNEREIGQEGEFIFDLTRINGDQVRERSRSFDGTFLPPRADGSPSSATIDQRMKSRRDRVREFKDPVLTRLISAFENTPGYMRRSELISESGDEGALATLLDMALLKASDDLIFDPLRMTRGSLKEMRQRQIIAPLREQLIALLELRPGKTAPRSDLTERFGSNALQMVLDGGGFGLFTVPTPRGDAVWVRIKGSDVEEARRVALDAVQPKDTDWEPYFALAGNKVRRGGHDGDNLRDKVVARTYTVSQAANRLGMRKDTVTAAIAEKLLPAFFDHEAVQRIPADRFEELLDDLNEIAEIAGLEVISTREIGIALNESAHSVTQKLRKAHITAFQRPRWRDIAGLWGLPGTLQDFRHLYAERKREWTETRENARAAERQKRDDARQTERLRREQERRQREMLREKLLAAFPTWQHAGRVDQRVFLHVGPPNSGKTHNALDALSVAQSGWYLAPLRLLAFEIFDRLNQRGIRCNLLTGEEYVNVPGAQITAATIEMFDPQHSGDCVVVDEAQMLADPDRGWAWTRALMEAQAPDIHVIGPPNARSLIERLATSAAIPYELVEHQRLAPLEVAKEPWPLDRIPDRTILVAFSRRMVLHLKTELEMRKRTVSVVYGNLPPEVRRRQADRFADGKTEICVATDAVGMGLNLPADQVCFFEMEKFDGRNMRELRSAEVHQIGGRAGRYGLSKTGLVGATNKRNLKVLGRLYQHAPADLAHARVAPTVADLELIPGNLAHRFAQWAELQSIPDTLRDVIRPADIDERIALARMLSDQEVNQLGLEAAVKIVNAPTREISRDYWRICTLAILGSRPMPMPPEAPYLIENNQQLDQTEEAISCADIYLWLARRPEFGQYAPDEDRVREMRTEWSMSIDAALLRRLDTLARCVNCRKPLPLGHRFSLCEDCFQHRRERWY